MEFESLIPPLTDEEYERLEKSVLDEGVREPIITWNGTIVDGHNRYHICEEHGIKCPQVEREFASRDEAKLFIISNQLARRNLPVAAIGDLKLEEKEIVARQAERRMLAGKSNPTPNLGEGKHDGETLEQLAKDIPLGRESLRKLDVIKRKAKEGDPVAISEREALISGEKKSIHGAYVAVVGKPQPRKPEETVTEDGRKICVMCGEPINEGEAHAARPTVHKKCEQEYQRDWERNRRSADTDLLNNVPTYTIDSLVTELASSVESMRVALAESIAINDSMGVHIDDERKALIDKAVSDLLDAINRIKE